MTEYGLKQKTIGFKMCNRCDLGIRENAWHIIRQCPYYNDERVEMYRELESLGDIWQSRLSERSQEMLYILLGMQREGFEFMEMFSQSNSWVSMC